MLVWPAGYRRQGATIYSVDQAVASVGDTVSVVGGSFTEENFQSLRRLLNTDLPGNCRIGTYWLAVAVRH